MEKFLPLILDESLEGVAFFDSRLHVVSWSRSCERIFKVKASHAIGQNLVDLIGGSTNVHSDLKALEECLSGKTTHLKSSSRHRNDGVWVSLEIKFTPRRSERGEVVGGAMLCADRSDLVYRDTVMKELQKVGKIIGWQYQVQEDMFSIVQGGEGVLASNEVEWSSFKDFKGAFALESRAVLDAALGKSIDAGEPFSDELDSVLEGVSLLRVSWQCETIFGKVVRIYGVVQDITQESESRKIIAEQELQIISRSRLAAVGELAAGVAHEINNPLAITSGAIEIINMKRKAGSLKDKELGGYLEKLSNGLDRIQVIVSSLLEFSRNDSQRKSEPFKLVDMIKSSLSFYGSQLKDAGIHCSLDYEDESLQVFGRSNEVDQVVLNIVKNARDFLVGEDMDDRRVKIEVYKASKNLIQVRISNNGRKISEDVAGRIFDPFFTTKEVGKGTGLGMSVSYNIINEHGGNLFLDLSRDETCFVIELPVAS